jgi:hypothetical protein
VEIGGEQGNSKGPPTYFVKDIGIGFGSCSMKSRPPDNWPRKITLLPSRSFLPSNEAASASAGPQEASTREFTASQSARALGGRKSVKEIRCLTSGPAAVA